LQYYKGTTPQSTTLTKVTTAGKTPTVGWRYSGSRFVSCSSTSDLNPGCNGYSFQTPSLPTQSIRAFYQLAINGLGYAWSFYGPTSCSHYFNGPFFAPIATPDFISGETDYIVCNPDPVFSGIVNYCSDASGFSGAATLTFTGPNGFSETINSNGTGALVIADTGEYTVTTNVPSSPLQCLDCSKSVCFNVTAADLVSCIVPLPIGLLSFTAQQLTKEVQLNWQTSTETNNDYFVIEKSIDGIVFNEIGKIKGAGTSSLPLSYLYYDSEAPYGDVYYRLKQVDYNGHFTLSKLVFVGANPNNILIFPNPNSGVFTLKSKARSQVKIENVLGEIVFEKIMSAGEETRIDISEVSEGLYFIYNSVDKSKTIQKMVINH
jgi:hypothetical protein